MLRAVAVLMVLVQHLPGLLPELSALWLPGGPLAHFNGGAGVDIFFCISGFVVTRSLLRDVEGLNRRQMFVVATGFWIRRAFRLWPSAWLWLFMAYAVSLGFNRFGEMDPSANLQMILAGIGMYSNYLLLQVCRAQQHLGIMSQYWSLSLEEQFYLALPLLLILSRRATLPVLMLYAGFRFWNYQDFWADILLRPGCLVAGVGLAYLESGSIWRLLQRTWPRGYASLVLCVILMLLAAVFDSIGPFDRWFGIAMFRLAAPLETAACSLIVLVAVQCSPIAPGALGRALVFLGSRSYAIYIVHMLAFAVAREIDGRLFSNTGNFAICCATAFVIASTLMIAASELTIRFVEQPLRARGRAITDRLSARPSYIGVRAPDTTVGSGGRRILDIEALRTVAIAFVMVEHATNNLVFQPTFWLDFLNYGQLWPGVDLFFVISGYLVTGDLLRRLDAEQGYKRSWRVARAFWFRRAWRLWPTAWLWLLLISAGSAVVDPPFLGPAVANLRSMLAGVFFYANYRFANKVVHFQAYGASYPYWSLSLEEQFYILLPLAMRVLGQYLPIAICLAILVQLPLAHGTYYFFFRSDALLWGVALAIWVRTPGYILCEPVFLRPRWVSAAFVVLSLGCLFRWAGPGNISVPFETGGIAALAALLVWVASYDRNYICPERARKFVMWSGSRSYALYVAHIPVFQCSAALAHALFAPETSIFSGASNVYAVVIALVFLVLCAEATHRYVEQPLRRYGAYLWQHNTRST